MNISTKLIKSKLVLSSITLGLMFALLSFVSPTETNTYSLTVKVKELRNSTGVLQFSLYNKDGSIPDEKFKKYYKQMTAKIVKGTSSVTFKNIPKGKYAVNILHDENKNKKIDKGWVLPIEGIGFSNFSSIGFTNRPNFKKASFTVSSNMTKTIKVIYM